MKTRAPILFSGLGLNCTSRVGGLRQQVVSASLPGGGDNLLAKAACRCDHAMEGYATSKPDRQDFFFVGFFVEKGNVTCGEKQDKNAEI